MADDPKSTSVKLRNSGSGARTFFNANREPVILARGATFEGDILDADKESLADLIDSGEGGGGTVGASGIDKAVDDYPDLDGKTRDELLGIAADEGYRQMADDASAENIRKAIENARKANAPLQQELSKLSGKSRADLVKAAEKEGVATETDDNRDQLARKLAEARSAK